ncbi:unnamed protein product [Rotaria magnacalcarata]|uniref:Uncharacterized protein n=1 Tax=Rotaria magnacalcarata TaxID=392030 RepID=A0A814K069_9BILA|nr:unnamed protein product [Rotaria magnacalcarata]
MAYNNDYEIEISDDSEATTTTTDVESSSFRDKPATNIKEKKISSSKSKRRCIFNQQWLKDPKYAPERYIITMEREQKEEEGESSKRAINNRHIPLLGF